MRREGGGETGASSVLCLRFAGAEEPAILTMPRMCLPKVLVLVARFFVEKDEGVGCSRCSEVLQGRRSSRNLRSSAKMPGRHVMLF